jgi:hypothetical protein
VAPCCLAFSVYDILSADCARIVTSLWESFENRPPHRIVRLGMFHRHRPGDEHGNPPHTAHDIIHHTIAVQWKCSWPNLTSVVTCYTAGMTLAVQFWFCFQPPVRLLGSHVASPTSVNTLPWSCNAIVHGTPRFITEFQKKKKNSPFSPDLRRFSPSPACSTRRPACPVWSPSCVGMTLYWWRNDPCYCMMKAHSPIIYTQLFVTRGTQ